MVGILWRQTYHHIRLSGACRKKGAVAGLAGWLIYLALAISWRVKEQKLAEGIFYAPARAPQ